MIMAQDVDSLFTIGKKLYNAGKYHESINVLDDVLAQDKYYYNAYFRKSYCNFHLKEYKTALRDIEYAFEIEMLDNRYFYMKASNFDKLGQYETALYYLDLAINFNKDNFNYISHRAGIFLEKGNYVKAIQDFNRILSLSPENYTAYYGRGLAKFNLKNKTGACMDWLYARDKDESNNRMFFYKCSDIDLRPYSFEVLPSAPFIEEPLFVYESDSGLNSFFFGRIKFPEKAIKEKMEGMVIVEFILTADKKINNIKILQSPDEIFSQEVIHILGESSPYWVNPLYIDGKATDYKFILPVSFKIRECGFPFNNLIDSVKVKFEEGKYPESFDLARKILDINPFLYEVFLIYKESGLKIKKEVSGEFYEYIRKEKAIFLDEVTCRDNIVKLYFNELWQLTSKEYGKNYRMTKCFYSKKPHGVFYDYSMDDKLIGQGKYFMNFRDSVFRGFYSNGETKYEIFFHDGHPKGNWRFYHSNGRINYEFDVAMDDFTIQTYKDSVGNDLLTNGSGKWSFRYLNYLGKDTINLEGFLKNYKMDGNWIFTMGDKLMLIESYENGEFISGRSFIKNEVKYRTSEINTWMITPISIIRSEKMEMDPAIENNIYDFLYQLEVKYPD